jgi:hypothetical protein
MALSGWSASLKFNPRYHFFRISIEQGNFQHAPSLLLLGKVYFCLTDNQLNAV